ncbi:glycosyltransferase family 2 protein [Geomonas edaphica]|uniref:glycosyltransferase family 2 protein n=1 Tax=Geomonas edaphica TaxID=2570226 RepID=UPI0013A5C284|nr:glycosyltransferase family 2 protein [Geomonas edaphica]
MHYAQGGAVAPPTLDVVIPVYNGESFIVQAIESVMSQDYLPVRIIVVDDGSTDRTAALVRELMGPVPILYHHQENSGLSAARNAGIRLCTSDYVAFLDADDEWYPEKLSSQLKLFAEGDWDNLGVVYCRYIHIDEVGHIANNYHVVAPDPENRGYIFERLLKANMITGSGSGVLVKRSCFERVSLFDEELKACEDWDMWLRLSREYQFDYVDHTLVKIRRHTNNMQKDHNHIYRNLFRFYDKWASEARRCRWQSNWRSMMICKIVRDLPDLSSYRLVTQSLSEDAKRQLFYGGDGWIIFFLILKTPSLLILALQRLLLRKRIS